MTLGLGRRSPASFMGLLLRKPEDSILQVLIHLLITVDEELVDVAEGIDEQVLKGAFRWLSTQSKGYYIEVLKQLQVETS